MEILNKKKIEKKISYVQKVNFSKIFDRLSNLSNIYNLKNNIYCLRLSRLGKEKLKKKKKNLIIEFFFDLIKFLNRNFKNNLKLDTNYTIMKQVLEKKKI